MTKLQASRLLTLAWHLRTRVDPKLFDMRWRCYGLLPQQSDYEHQAAESWRCGTSACALGYCAEVWPNHFKLYSATAEGYAMQRLGEVRLRGVRVNDPSMPLLDWFGLADAEAKLLFGAKASTPARKARQIEDLVLSRGWEYA